MRRRAKSVKDDGQMPARLLHYDPADWPNPRCHPECAFWEEVAEWDKTNPASDDMPLVIVRGPDTPWHPELI